MKGLYALLLIGLLGCGVDPHRSLTVIGINTAPLSVSGFVTTIQLTTSATNLGSNSLVTVVTFIPQFPQFAPLTSITFCGNVSTQFIQNTFTTVQFTPGLGCATIVSLLPMTFVSITGFVSIVQLTGAGGLPVTMVTFLMPGPLGGLSETVGFCGNVVKQFLVNGTMIVSFTPGTVCSSIVSAVVV